MPSYPSRLSFIQIFLLVCCFHVIILKRVLMKHVPGYGSRLYECGDYPIYKH